jgi:hypothetical protein
MSGKGSRPRPMTVPPATYATNWLKVFGPKGKA